MASPTLQFKRGAFVNLPGLRAGEPGFTTDRYDLYVGLTSATETNQFFGSARYWKREDGDAAAEFKFVDADGINGISLRSPVDVGAGVTYTLPELGDEGHFLKLGEDGALEWASVSAGASFSGATLTDTTFSGISTFNGLIDATEGLDVSGHTELEDLNVSGIGTIATVDINGGDIDGTVIGASSPAEATFTELAYSNSTTSGISTVGELYVGVSSVLSVDGGALTLSNIDAIDETTRLTLESALSLDPNDFSSLNISGIATFSGFIDAKAGLGVTGGSTFDDVNVTGVSTFTGTLNSSTLIAATNLTASGVSTLTTLEVTGNTTLGDNSSDTLTVEATSTFNGDATFLGTLTGTISTATRATTVDTTATSDDVSYFIPFVASSSSTTGETIRVDAGISYNPSTDTLDVANVETGAVKAKDGTGAITISDVTGNVSFASTVTITGDLQILGSTTTVNTETLLVKDPIIDIGLIDNGNGGLVAPGTETATDLALVFHYYDSSAKQSSLYWDHDNENGERFILASTLTGHTVGTATTSVEASAYAALEVGTLWVNNACSGGAQEVIGCNGNSELALMNIVVDAGEF